MLKHLVQHLTTLPLIGVEVSSAAGSDSHLEALKVTVTFRPKK